MFTPHYLPLDISFHVLGTGDMREHLGLEDRKGWGSIAWSRHILHKVLHGLCDGLVVAGEQNVAP
jgi:hypothetical protein